MPTVLLVRHGRTTANSAGVLAGWTPGVGLDDAGTEQVRALAARLAGLPLVQLRTSPLQRCRETAALLLAGREVPVHVEDDLGECRYGAWTGRRIAELTGEPLWRVVQDQPSAAVFPPSPEHEHESLAQMSARAVAAVRRADAAVEAAHGAGAIWVAVSHGDVIKAVLADAMGTHLDEFQRIHVGPASLSAVRYTSRRPFVLRVNDTGTQLGDLRPDDDAAAQQGDATPGGGAGARSAAGDVA